LQYRLYSNTGDQRDGFGFRDTVQDFLGVTGMMPDQVRERICVLHYARATEIVAGEMKMLGSKPEGAPATAPAPTASEPRPATAPAAGNFNDFEDDIPF